MGDLSGSGSNVDRLVPVRPSSKSMKFLRTRIWCWWKRTGHLVLDESEETRNAASKFLD